MPARHHVPFVPRFRRWPGHNLATLAEAIALPPTARQNARFEVTVAEDDYRADLPVRIEALTAGLPVECCAAANVATKPFGWPPRPANPGRVEPARCV
jgi:hypothetical protein